MSVVITVGLVALAVIHLLPAIGVLGAERLYTLYGVEFSDPNSLLLMRHRAALFAIVGVFTLLAVFRIDWQWPALIMVAASTLSFIILALHEQAYNERITTVFWVDIVAVAIVLVVVVARFLHQYGAN